jgi:hypothetical protein
MDECAIQLVQDANRQSWLEHILAASQVDHLQRRDRAERRVKFDGARHPPGLPLSFLPETGHQGPANLFDDAPAGRMADHRSVRWI